MALQDRKKHALQVFRERMGDLKLAAKTRASGNRLTVSYPDGTMVVIQMLTIRGGLGAGEFAAYSTLGIYSGPVFRTLRDIRLDGGSDYPKDLIVQGTSHELVAGQKRGTYAFRASSDVDQMAGRLAKDIAANYVPIVHGFTGEYEAAVEFILDTSGAHVRKPFCMSLVLLGLADALARRQEVIRRARQDKGFWDYHRAKEPEGIVRRVVEWFERQELSERATSVKKL